MHPSDKPELAPFNRCQGTHSHGSPCSIRPW
jgi:hypothetical protein